jgi:hypothetical protein
MLVRAGTLGRVVDALLTDIKLERCTSQIFLSSSNVMNSGVLRPRGIRSAVSPFQQRLLWALQAIEGTPRSDRFRAASAIFLCKKIAPSRRPL